MAASKMSQQEWSHMAMQASVSINGYENLLELVLERCKQAGAVENSSLRFKGQKAEEVYRFILEEYRSAQCID